MNKKLSAPQSTPKNISAAMKNAVFFCFLLFRVPLAQSEDIQGAPAPASPCKTGGQYVQNVPDTGVCWWDAQHESSGVALFAQGQDLNSTGNIQGMFTGFENSYVPYTNKWKMRAHYCAATTPGSCSLQQSTQQVDSANAVELSSSIRIIEQNPDFGGGIGGTLVADSSLCFTFVDSEGREWKTEALRTCQDARGLPQVPAICTVNEGADLKIDFGELEREEITDTPALSSQTIQANVPVVCSGDATLNMNMTIQYQPVTISGQQLIATTSNGLAVAVAYNGQLLAPSAPPLQLSFSPGSSSFALDFTPVRDPLVPANSLPTGDFTASATLIMSTQ